MEFGIIPLIYIVTITFAIALHKLFRHSMVSYPLFLVLLGFIVGYFMVHNGLDSGMRAADFQWLSFYVFIPILIFSSAINLSYDRLVKYLPAIVYLSIPGLVLTLLLVSSILFFTIKEPASFPWLAALLTAAIISATGSSPIHDVFKDFGVSEKIKTIVETESLFSNIIIIVIFQIILFTALQSSSHMKNWGLEFTQQIAGGIFSGIMVGGISLGLIKIYESHSSKQQVGRNPHCILLALFSIASAYTAYLIGQDVLHASGAVAVALTAILYSQLGKPMLSDHAKIFVNDVWEILSEVAYACIFLLVGLAMTLNMFTEHCKTIVIAIVALAIARAGICYFSAPLSRIKHSNSANNTNKLNWHERNLLFLGSTRDVFAAALALSLPTSLDYWWTIQATVFGVVLFSVVLKLPLTRIYLKRYSQ